jgi:tetratricopeptide (TPR) repeat protein
MFSRGFFQRGIWLPAWALFWALAGTPAHGAGTPGAGEDDLLAGQTVDQAAANWYTEGMAQKEAALASEREASEAANPTERERLLAAANGHYKAAAAAHGKALKLHLGYYQAANELGFALRKTGAFQKALGAYNFALIIKPDFYPAIEYRGEAYLALGRLPEAQAAYVTLFRNEPALAARLLAVMADHPVTADDGAFRVWVEEREALAALTPTDGATTGNWQ